MRVRLLRLPKQNSCQFFAVSQLFIPGDMVVFRKMGHIFIIGHIFCKLPHTFFNLDYSLNPFTVGFLRDFELI